MQHREFMDALARGPYAWPGGYPLFLVTTESECYSFSAAWRDRAEIFRAIADGFGPRPEVFDVNWENGELFCDSSGDLIEAAYVDQGPEGLARFGIEDWQDYLVWRQRYKTRHTEDANGCSW